MADRSTRIACSLAAPVERVYRALTNAEDIQTWRVPTGMTSQVHSFYAREGGAFRVSLTYDSPTGTGKTTPQTDTYHGRFVSLIPNQRVVEVMEFETDDPAMQGEMMITYSLSSTDRGTDLVAVHDHVPAGVSLADNDLGWQLSLAKLKALVESDVA